MGGLSVNMELGLIKHDALAYAYQCLPGPTLERRAPYTRHTSGAARVNTAIALNNMKCCMSRRRAKAANDGKLPASLHYYTFITEQLEYLVSKPSCLVSTC